MAHKVDVGKISGDKAGFDQLHLEIHELCQPLTALQCRLEIGRMMGDDVALREAVDGGLDETQRMFEAVHRIRLWMQQAEANGSRTERTE